MSNVPWINGPDADNAISVNTTVTSGSTLAVPNNVSEFVINHGSLAALTVTLPSAPEPGQKLTLHFVGAVTALTVSDPNSTTIQNGPTAAAANSKLEFLYDATTPEWFQ